MTLKADAVGDLAASYFYQSTFLRTNILFDVVQSIVTIGMDPYYKGQNPSTYEVWSSTFPENERAALGKKMTRDAERAGGYTNNFKIMKIVNKGEIVPGT